MRCGGVGKCSTHHGKPPLSRHHRASRLNFLQSVQDQMILSIYSEIPGDIERVFLQNRQLQLPKPNRTTYG
jgi:hypothetical protein